MNVTHPATARVAQVDDYHGMRIDDPYRWLEDLDSAETAAWVATQDDFAHRLLDRLPEREGLRARLEKLWNYERRTAPARRGSRSFYFRNSGLQNQDILYVQERSNSDERVLLDPNLLSDDGTVSLATSRVSETGRYLAYALSTSGSDWQEWRVRDVGSGKDLIDVVRWAKFSGASWLPDDSGFYYSGFGEQRSGAALADVNRGHRLYLHRLGKAQDADQVVFQDPSHPEWWVEGEVTEDGQYLVVSVDTGAASNNALFVTAAGAVGAPMVPVFAEFDATYQLITNQGSTLVVLTNSGAPNSRIISVPVEPGRAGSSRELVAEAEDALVFASAVGSRIFATYLKDAAAEVRVFDLDGRLDGVVSLPALGAVEGFQGRRRDADTYYSFTSFTTPPTLYRYDIESGRSTVFWRPATAFDPAELVTEQGFATSPDGTRVPVFVSHRRDVVSNAARPTYLTGYGGFRIPMVPSYSSSAVAWMQEGGVWAVAALRGGSEYGEKWHAAGMGPHKQNVFDDFIAVAEWLSTQGWCSPSTLAISGRSNGGLLMGAMLTQRPELFGAVNVGVGVLDMLRYHLFTIGWAWVDEYGSAADQAEFQVLHAYSPVHNIRTGHRYPPTIITTADHDDRVVPLHSFKFAATLQAAQAGEAPVIARIERKAGHGDGKPTSKAIDESADILAFLLHACRGDDWPR
ncbi:MAG TPA: prolyl oligopeptidase family serine peptidase [Candidatus Dormibacteraeota bacterium]|nr:prolyl oligopeptidase family serine peptidase [Candidatus Dormibacteraeota bacterium]